MIDFQIQTVVWAITLNDPVWPAVVQKKNKKTFTVRFFGQNSQAKVPSFDLFHYEQYKEKYGSNVNNKNLQNAMRLAQNYIENKKLKNNNNNLKDKSQIYIQLLTLNRREDSSNQNHESKEKSNNQSQINKKRGTLKKVITTQQCPQNIVKYQNKKQSINQKSNKKTQQYYQHLRNQIKKREGISMPTPILHQIKKLKKFEPYVPFQIKYKQAKQREKEQQNKQIMVIQKTEYMRSHNKDNIAKNLKMQMKLQEIILLVIQNEDCEFINLKRHLKQFEEIYGQGLSLQKWIFTKIPKLMYYIKTKLIQFQPNLFENQIKFLEHEHSKIALFTFNRIRNIEPYHNLFKINKNKIQQNHTQIQQNVHRPNAIIRIFNILQSLLQTQCQNKLRQYSCSIENKIFNSSCPYIELLERIQTKLQNLKTNNGLMNMVQIQNELSSIL